MGAPALTTAAQLLCPHGGTVTIIPSNPGADADGAKIATVADTFIIAGCAFVVPPLGPSPCVTVQWVTHDNVVTINGIPTLNKDSVGLCLNASKAPQGPVMIVMTQPNISTE
jgi:hypothetical protein